jgi:heme exporter protein B
MSFLVHSWLIASKDLRSEWRTKETLNASLSFALVILLLFSFAFDPDSDMVREISGGLLWLVFLFAGALILNRSFARELPNDCLDALIASPASGAELFLGKAMSSFTLLLVVEAITLPAYGIFYNAHWTRQLGLLSIVLLLASWAIAVIGTMFSALTVNLRLRELMLPTLVYPFVVPALMAAIQLTNALIGGDTLDKDNYIWFKVLVAFDVIFTMLALAMADIVLVG